jgi:hypothetical protein
MNLRYFYRFAIAATALGYSATFLNAQSAAVQQGSDRAITSLTNLNSHRKDPTPLDRVDASVNDTIDVSIAEDPSSGRSEVANSSEVPASRRAAGQGPTVLIYSSRLAQSISSQNLTASRAYTHPASLGTQLSTAPSSFARASMHPPIDFPDRRRTSSAKKGDVLCGKRAGQMGSGLLGKPERIFGAENDKDACQREIFVSDAGAASIQGEQPGALERITDPFSELLRNSFEGFSKGLDMEQPCGVACDLRSTGQFKSFGAHTPASDQSTKRRGSHDSPAEQGTGPAPLGPAARTD